jgi:hypothetical protein
MANSYTDQQSMIAQLLSGQGAQLAQNRMGLGTNISNLLTGYGGDQAQLAQNYGTALASPYARAANTPATPSASTQLLGMAGGFLSSGAANNWFNQSPYNTGMPANTGMTNSGMMIDYGRRY